ncbi:hypothetical protein [Eubacterium ventriosum]|uniref:hypothetical protein n=1 Tax=Eubacterium ventriosum TaxID=39496 RepID=UPI003AB4672B
MIEEYTDCTEFMRLIAEKKIKPAIVKKYLASTGIVLTASNSEQFAKDAYTILLGGREIEKITHFVISDANYEKSVLINAKKKNDNDVDILDYFADEFNSIRLHAFSDYMIEQPIKIDNELRVHMAYKKKNIGRNKLMEEEMRHMRIFIRKKSESEVSIDIRQPSSFDAKRAIDLLNKMTSSEESEVFLAQINLDLLTDKNKVSFFDKLLSMKFDDWKLKTVTGITVKRSNHIGEEENIEDDEGESNKALIGINQAVLNGSGLRSNDFVQNSLAQGYFISSMKYRYECQEEVEEFIVSISSKNNNLRVDIDKSYCDEDGKLYVQPFSKDKQDKIIQVFQEAANDIFYELSNKQNA